MSECPTIGQLNLDESPELGPPWLWRTGTNLQLIFIQAEPAEANTEVAHDCRNHCVIAEPCRHLKRLLIGAHGLIVGPITRSQCAQTCEKLNCDEVRSSTPLEVACHCVDLVTAGQSVAS